ncbi:hypothetical protein C5E23_02215 [Pectobacterium parmentieri]|nr:hypothetical protein C5E25_02230 [Pectobacterium parmentieri]AYH13106.1 hypothetical protein C5E23_02215 [Pectobacterium parmentieri]AYH21808.1 hypothetical protein C5E21_02210 [Pectobacterium parmentieri]
MAAAAAMMWRRQTGTSQRGGSVSAGKSARRVVGVMGLLMWTKTLPERPLLQGVKCAKKYDCIRIVPMTR